LFNRFLPLLFIGKETLSRFGFQWGSLPILDRIDEGFCQRDR
jgi:hypothetical protein